MTLHAGQVFADWLQSNFTPSNSWASQMGSLDTRLKLEVCGRSLVVLESGTCHGQPTFPSGSIWDL